jgi:hypothetical protein
MLAGLSLKGHTPTGPLRATGEISFLSSALNLSNYFGQLPVERTQAIFDWLLMQ